MSLIEDLRKPLLNSAKLDGEYGYFTKVYSDRLLERLKGYLKDYKRYIGKPRSKYYQILSVSGYNMDASRTYNMRFEDAITYLIRQGEEFAEAEEELRNVLAPFVWNGWLLNYTSVTRFLWDNFLGWLCENIPRESHENISLCKRVEDWYFLLESDSDARSLYDRASPILEEFKDTIIMQKYEFGVFLTK